MSKAAKVIISGEFLLEKFYFPPGTKIIAIGAKERKSWIDDGVYEVYYDLVLTIEHEDLKEVGEEETIPIANPTWTRQEEIIFNGWGQK